MSSQEYDLFIQLLDALDGLPFYSENADYFKKLLSNYCNNMDILPTKYIPNEPGIYLVYDPTSSCYICGRILYPVVYIGKTEKRSLKERIGDHIYGNVKSSALRESIGEALLDKFDFDEDKSIYSHRFYLHSYKFLHSSLEDEISRIVENYWFRAITISEEFSMDKLEEALIYLFDKYQICCSKDDLLRVYAKRTLWNKEPKKKKINSTHLNYIQRLINHIQNQGSQNTSTSQSQSP